MEGEEGGAEADPHQPPHLPGGVELAAPFRQPVPASPHQEAFPGHDGQVGEDHEGVSVED